MAFVAHAAVQLANDECPNEKNLWHFVKQINGIEYRWRFRKDYLYELVAGVFEDPNDALKCAKQMYVSLFYELVWRGFQIKDAGCSSYEIRLSHNEEPKVRGYQGDESFFFWNKHYRGGRIGPGVFEVNRSIDEFDEYHFLEARFSIIRDSDLNLENVDAYHFSYCREAQEFFNTIMLAENASDYGMKMTIYCGLLEHLSESKDKERDVIRVIGQLINSVDDSDLSPEKKESLKNYLRNGRRMSARQRCVTLCERYAKLNYGGFSCKKIIDEAYSIRSAFSHGENCENRYSLCAAYIRRLTLDVIKNYMKEKETTTHV